MSETARKTRLVRLVGALGKLRQVEIAKHLRATALQADAEATAKTLDAIDLGGCETWAQFPQNWLNFRSKLDRDVVDSAAKIEACAREALRLEKVMERITQSVDKINLDAAEKQAAEEIMEFVAMTARATRLGQA